MGTRYKPNAGKLNSLEDVNLALKDIGLAEKELETPSPPYRNKQR